MEQLTEEQRKKLDGIVNQMTADGESSANIQFVVDDFKSLYEGKTNAVAEETVPAIAENPNNLDSQLQDGSSEQPIVEEPKNWFEENIGDDILFIEGLSDLYRDVTRGGSRGLTTDESSAVFFGDSSKETLDEYAGALKAVSEIPQSEEMQKYQRYLKEYKEQGDGDSLAWFKAQAKSTIKGDGVLMGMFVESLASQASTPFASPEQFAAVGAGAAATGAASAAIGATASSFTGPFAALFAGFSGAGGAFAGARSSSMMILETTSTFNDLLAEEITNAGGDPLNVDDIRKVVENKEVMDRLRRESLAAGATISAFELASGLAATSVAAKAVTTTAAKAGRAVKVAGIEAVGGGAGEIAGRTASGQEIKAEDVLTEAFTGAGMSAADIAVAGISKKGLAEYALNGEKDVKVKAEIEDLVENGTDEQFVNVKVKVSNDKELNDAIQQRRKKIIKENKQVVKDKIRPQKATDLKRKIELEIKKTKAEIEQIIKTDGEVVAEAAKNRVKVLEQQLTALDSHINYQLDELNETETLSLMNMDDDVSLYQGVLNDPRSSEAAKKSAQSELLRLKEAQIQTLNNTDSTDLANPDGPTKQKNIDLSKKTQDAYERGDTDGIIKAQGGMISSVATSLWSRIPADKQVGTYDGFKAALVSSKGGLLDLIGTYKPETGVPLAAWLGNKQTGLRIRANRIVKELTKQDIEVSTDSTEALNSFSSNEIDTDNINLGPKYNSQRLGLGVNLLNESANNVELGQVAIEKALAEADAKAETKGKPLSQKQRQTVSEKAFNKFFKDQYVQTVKDRMGKKLDLKDYIKNNVSTLKRIALSNIDFQMGTGITKDWNKYPPSDQVFQDYYEGTDTDNAQAISDRKKKLAEAVSDQIGKDAKDNYFEGKEAERAKIGEDLGISYQRDEEIQEQIDEITGQNILIDETTEGDAEASITNINKLAKQLGIENFDRRNPKFIKRVTKSLSKVADLGLLTIEMLEGLSMANFGAVNERRADGNKYYKLKDGTFILGIETGKTDAKGNKAFKAPKGDLMPKDGGLFYSVNDPAFISIKNKILKANNNKGTKSVAPAVNIEATKKDSKTYKENKNKQENNKKAFNEFLGAMDSIAQIDPSLMLVMVHDAYRGSNGIIKVVAPVKYFSKTLEFGTKGTKYGESYKNNKERNYRDEHNPPASVIGSYIAKHALLGKSRETSPAYMKQFHRVVLSLKSDEILDKAKLGGIMPKNFRLIFSNSLGRYFNQFTSKINGGIDPDGIIDIETGKSIREIYGIDSSGIAASLELTEKFKDKTPDKIQSAIQKQEDLNSDPKLNDAEKAEALSDLLSSVYGVQVTSDKQVAIDYLIEQGKSKEEATADVEARGFKGPGFIYVNPSKAGIDTAMHEFTHLWADLVYAKDPDLFNAIFEKLKGHPRYQEAVDRMSKKGYDKLIPGSYEYNNEIMAHILGEEGKSLYELFEGDAEAKTLIDKFFDYIKEALGFDPATKNFADLTVDEVIKLAVKDISEGNPAANFDKLKNVAEGKSWYAKTEATQSPSAKAKSDPLIRALNKLKLSYRENKNLAQAINDAYSEVEGTMDFLEFARLIAKNTKEIPSGKSKQLLIGKAAIMKAERIAEESAKKNEEGKLSEEKGKKMADKLRAIIYGKTSKPSRWFIPPNAEDFKGLLYAFLPGGKAGVEAKKWLTETLLKPYSDAIAALDTEILNKTNAWKKLSKGFDFNKKVGGTPYTLGDAIKIYNGLKNGQDPNIAKKKHLDALIHAVESDGAVLDFANEVNESFPIDVTSGWQNRSFAKEIFDSINDGARKRHLVTFSANVDAIFTDATLDLIADQYGVKYKQALVSTLSRMKSGRNRVGTDASANSYMNWINRAVGTTMFLNTRSAFLQTLSSLNFINKPGNNLFQAMKAFGDQKQWKKDYNLLWNSDYLTNRRDGAKFDVLADEMSQGDVKGIEKLLKAGFLPTRYADSFAIAMGGAAFYRNRINMLTKDGMSKADAEAQAMIDWREAAEESQQSADPSKISEIQSSSIGKLIYAFANTPFQYARLTKRKLQDLTSGRSAAEGNVQKDIQSLLYYSVLQSVMFNALQGGLVALTMGNDPDDEELKDEKYAQILERTLTSYAKSIGNPGAVAATLYAMLKEGHMQQTGERRKDANVFALTATSISPPLNSKLKDLSAAYRAYNKIDENDLVTPSLDSDALTMAGETASFIGVPLDRVIKKTRHLAAITNEEVELWQKVWMLAGWSEWELGVGRDSKKKKSFKEKSFKNNKFKSKEFKKTAFKKLENGVAGRANRDGTIELDPNLSPVEREITIAHEKKHMEDMKSGKLDYDDNYVYWNGAKYARVNGKIKYKGKSYIEGHKSLPWEKVAYAAEPSASAVKRKLY